jgi:hypothetical protein
MNTYATVILTMFGVAGSGWASHEYLHNTFAPKEVVLVAESKADFVLDQQMAAIVGEIGYLERKQKLTQTELNRLNYLRSQLDLMRKVRAGK